MDIRELRNINTDMLPSVIWDWCARPTPEKIDNALFRFSEMNIKKVFIRPSNGLVIKYLSDDFFELIRTSARRSAKYGISLWICDDLGVSSGTGGGEIISVDDYRMRDFLKINPKDKEKTDKVIIENNDETLVLRDMSKMRVGKRYAVADITDDFVTDCFIGEVYEKYFKECKRFIGYEIEGFSASLNMTSSSLYSKSAEPDLKKIGKAFLEGNEKVKTEYYENLNNALLSNFTDKIGATLKGKELLFSIGVSGDFVTSRQLHYIKSDMPYLEIDFQNIDIVEIKLLTSICSQFEKMPSFRMKTPSYSNCSERFSLAMQLSSLGGKIVYDSIPFSLTDRRKYEKHNTILSPFAEKDMAQRIARMCSTANSLEDKSDLLLIFPTKMTNSGEVYDEFLALANELYEKNIPFHISDEYVLSSFAQKCENKIKIGKNTYSKVLMPDGVSYFDKTVSLLDGVERFGISESVTPFSSDGKITFSVRTSENQTFYFVTALEDAQITYNGENTLYIMDMADGEVYRVPVQSFKMKKGQTACFFTDSEDIYCDDAPPIAGGVIFEDFEDSHTLPFTLTYYDDNLLPLKKVNACFGRKAYRESLTDDLHKEFYSLFEGEVVRVKYPFNVSFIPDRLECFIENASSIDKITINGTEIEDLTPSEKDTSFFGTDIAPYLAEGKNTLMLEYKKHNNYDSSFVGLAPSYYAVYDLTSFEPVILKGDFDFTDEKICKRDETATTSPYYYGKMVYTVSLPESDLNGKKLKVTGDFDICKVRIGKRESYFFNNDALIELFDLDCGGTAEITIYNTPYNLFRKEEENAQSFKITDVKLCY